MTKIIFDKILALCGLLFLFPFLIIISIIIKVKMPGNIFFKQKRVGQYGVIFTIIKFRTMVENNNKNTVSVKGDKRITPLGVFLRKYKIDELPELWNIIKGDMSFVGPRPDVPGYADKLKGESRKILDLKPGITGPASLKYSNEEEILANVENPIWYNDNVIFPDKVKINLEYIKNNSVKGDLKIIFNTIFRNNY